MKFEVFEEIVNLLKEQHVKEHDLYDAGVDLIDFNDTVHSAVSHLIGVIYGIEGRDMFNWWCYEQDFGSLKDEGVGICQSLTDLYEYLEKNKTDEYELPTKLTLEERLSLITSIFGGNIGNA